MDLGLFFGVLARHKLLVLGGTVLGVILAVFAYGTPSTHGITPRGQETWQSQSTLLITYPGDPYGRTSVVSANSNLTNVSALSLVYSNLANSDQVQNQVLQGAPKGATVKGAPIYDANSGLPQPFVTITATAPTGAASQRLASRAATDLQNYVTAQEATSNVPTDQRIQLQVLQNGAKPQLVTGHKVTLSVLVLFAVLTAVVSLAFILENVRSRRPQGRRQSPRPVAAAVATAETKPRAVVSRRQRRAIAAAADRPSGRSPTTDEDSAADVFMAEDEPGPVAAGDEPRRNGGWDAEPAIDAGEPDSDTVEYVTRLLGALDVGARKGGGQQPPEE